MQGGTLCEIYEAFRKKKKGLGGATYHFSVCCALPYIIFPLVLIFFSGKDPGKYCAFQPTLLLIFKL